MSRNEANHLVFYCHSSAECIYLVVYVDDIVLTGSDPWHLIGKATPLSPLSNQRPWQTQILGIIWVKQSLKALQFGEITQMTLIFDN